MSRKMIDLNCDMATAMRRIEEALNHLYGVGQNVEIKGGRITGVSPGQRSGEVLTVEQIASLTGGSVKIDNKTIRTNTSGELYVALATDSKLMESPRTDDPGLLVDDELAAGTYMAIATYDPQAKAGDAFDTDNHTDGTTNKVYTATEKTKLAGIATGAEINVNADWNAVSGDAQILNKPITYGRVTGSNVTTTNTTLTDITGMLVALAANTVYEFEAIISALNDNDTNGVAYGLHFSAAGASVEGQATGTYIATDLTRTERVSALDTTTGGWVGIANGTGGIIIKGIVTTSANAGDFSVQHRKVTSGTSTVYINSFLKVWKIA